MEILIVVAIIGTVLTISIPAVERITLQRISSTTRRFLGIARTVRNDAVLLNNIHRLVFDLNKNTWGVQGQRQLKALAARDSSKETQKDEASNFEFLEKFSKSMVSMPGGTQIMGVYKEGEGTVQKGTAAVHFFPNGYNEPAILYFGKAGKTEVIYSLRIPATGKADVQPGTVQDFD